ncbi:MAG: efflux transporter outer membrane subunit [Alphaproteobacteria bacterium]
MKKTLTAILLVLSLGACDMIPDMETPKFSLSDTWKEQPVNIVKPGKAKEKAPVAVVTEAPAINADWWRNFGSAELDGLMDRALEQNNDLRAAIARINQARAAMKIAGASAYPSVDASAGARETRTVPGSWGNSGSVGLDISYEVDLFGRNKAGRKAAKADFRASQYDHDALALIVMGDVAEGYFRTVNLRERAAIAQNNLSNSRNVLKLVQARFDAGASSALDLSRQKAEMATTEASLAALQAQASQAENALAILLGTPPHDMGLKTKALSAIKQPAVPLSQPAQVITQRPDIRAAEQTLVAANADIGAARAAFYPTFNIGTSAAASFAALSNPVARTLEIAASIIAPIFHGGELEGGVERATARQVELAENYRKVVLVALREVEDALSAAKAAKSRERSFATAMAEARKTYNLSRELYDAGSVDYQTLLDSQRTLLSAEDSHSAVRLELLSAQVDLYKALGGGWRDTQTAKKSVAKK